MVEGRAGVFVVPVWARRCKTMRNNDEACEKACKTVLVVHELCPVKEALDGAIAGMESGMPETFAQLDELLGTLGARR